MITINEKMSSFEKELKKVFRQLKYSKYASDAYYKMFVFDDIRVGDTVYGVFIVHRVNIGVYHIDEEVTIEIGDKLHVIKSTDNVPELIKKPVETLARLLYSKLKMLGFQPRQIDRAHSFILSIEKVVVQSQDNIDSFTDNIKNKYNFQDEIKKVGFKKDMGRERRKRV